MRMMSAWHHPFLVTSVLVMVVMLGLHLHGESEDQRTEGEGILDDQFLSQLKGPLEASHQWVLGTLQNQYLIPPSTLPYNFTYRKPSVSNHLRQQLSWSFYHHYITWLFSDKRGGFFVEAGALDGEFLSNTLWLEENLGWTGLLIEADPNNFRHLTWKRRRAWTSNTCVAEGSYPTKAVFESLDTLPNRPKGSNWLYRANSHIANSIFATLNDDLHVSSRRSYSTVQCFPLLSYLLVLNVSVVDLLSLDMQGNEWRALQSLPLHKLDVRGLAVEHVPSKTAPKESFELDHNFISYMNSIGYRLIDTYANVDYFFVQEKDTQIRQKRESDFMKKFYPHVGK